MKAGFVNEQVNDKSEEAYQSTYGILLSQRLALMQVDNSKVHQGFEKATCSDLTTVIAGRCKSKSKVRAVDTVTI